MSGLLTNNPTAIRQLMDEAIFSIPTDDHFVQDEREFTKSDIDDDSIPTKTETPLVFWGGNEKHILFFVRSSASDYFSKEASEAFLKTLGALALDIQDVAVINLENTFRTLPDILVELQPKCCIFCEGKTAEQGSPFNEIIKREELNLLYTYSFEEMLNDTSKKRLFWNAIKEII